MRHLPMSGWLPTAAMPRRAPVDRRASIAGVLGDMRRHIHRTQFVNEVGGVEVLVTAERDRPRPVGVGLDHMKRRHPLRMTVGLCQAGIDKEARAVLHQAMADEAQLGLLARSLAVEPGIWIGRAGMGLIRSLLPVEVGVGIAPAIGRRLVAVAIARLKAHASIS